MILLYFRLLTVQKGPVLFKDLLKRQNWAYQWKILFNPDRAKQDQEFTFLRKTNKSIYPHLYFNNAAVKQK